MVRSRSLLVGLLAFALVSFPSVAVSDPSEDPVRVIVGLDVPFRPEGTLGDGAIERQRREADLVREALLERLPRGSFDVARTYSSIPYVALELNEQALEAVRRSPLVATVTPDRLRRPVLDQSVPLVQADDMHTLGFDGTGQTVAVIDSGVEKTHPFLSGAVVEEACYASGPTDGTDTAPGNCPNGLEAQTGTGSGVPCAPAGCFHGTHVAGIVAGNDPAVPRVGMAPGAGIMAVQVFSTFTGDACSPNPSPCVSAWDSDIIKGLERVYALRSTYTFAAVNMSLGGGAFSSYCDGSSGATKAVIDNLRSASIATVVASGNAGELDAISSPACISSAVSVGSTTKGDEVSGFSNSAPFLRLLAPGSSITSSKLSGTYGAASGTSMAAPHVAGAWALLRDAGLGPGVDEVLGALQNEGLEITDVNEVITPRIRVNDARSWPGLLNDDFVDAEVRAIPFQDAGTWTVSATSEQPSEGSTLCGQNAGRSVWYRVVPTESGEVTVSTAGSQYDTVLGVWTGSSLGALSQVGCNDDVSAADNTSTVSFSATAGTAYHVQVSGWRSDHGRLMLGASGGSAPPTPAPTSAGRTVSLSLARHLRARGVVSSTDDSCESAASVTIERRRGGGWVAVRSVTTAPDGTYRARLRDRAGRYRAHASASPGCGDATSRPARHRH